MNKKILIVVGILVVIVGCYGVYRVYKHFARLAATPSVQTQTSATPAPAASSLKDLISQGISESCTFSNDSSKGTVYVSSGKVRGDFSSTTNGTVINSHMIVSDNTSYIWTDGSKTGFKMSFNPNATPSATASTSPSGGFDASAAMNYQCSPWVVDSSLFILPAGVQFMSFGATVPQLASPSSATTSSNSSQCSYCDSLTGDSKTQCLTALKCQ